MITTESSELFKESLKKEGTMTAIAIAFVVAYLDSLQSDLIQLNEKLDRLVGHLGA